MGNRAGNTRVSTNCTSDSVHVVSSEGKFTFRNTPEGSSADVGGCVSSAFTKCTVSAAFDTAFSMLVDVGSSVRSVQASCDVPVPEKAIDGMPSFAPSIAAAL